MKLIEIETFIEDVVEEGKDPRDISHALVDRFLFEADVDPDIITPEEMSMFSKVMEKSKFMEQIFDHYMKGGVVNFGSHANAKNSQKAFRDYMSLVKFVKGKLGEEKYNKILSFYTGSGKKEFDYTPETFGKIFDRAQRGIAVAQRFIEKPDPGATAPDVDTTVVGSPPEDLPQTLSAQREYFKAHYESLKQLIKDYEKNPSADTREVLRMQASDLGQILKDDPETYKKLAGEVEGSTGEFTDLVRQAVDIVAKSKPQKKKPEVVIEPDEPKKEPPPEPKTEPPPKIEPETKTEPTQTKEELAAALKDHLDLIFQHYNKEANDSFKLVSELRYSKNLTDLKRAKEISKELGAFEARVLGNKDFKKYLELTGADVNEVIAPFREIAIKYRELNKEVENEILNLKDAEGGEEGMETVSADAEKQAQEKEAEQATDPYEKEDQRQKQNAKDSKKADDVQKKQSKDKTLHPDEQEDDEDDTEAEVEKQKAKVNKEASKETKDGEAPAVSHTSQGGTGREEQTFHDKYVKKGLEKTKRWAGDFKAFITRFGLNVFRGEKSRLYAGICAGLVVGVVIKYSISWVKNRHIRRVSILATNKAMMMADMEGLAVTPKAMRKAFKQMTRSPLIQAKIKRYLDRGKSVGLQYQALDNVATYISKELIRYFKRMGVGRVPPSLTVPYPGDPPSARGYIHPPGFRDAVGYPHSGIGGRQDGTEFPGGI